MTARRMARGFYIYNEVLICFGPLSRQWFNKVTTQHNELFEIRCMYEWYSSMSFTLTNLLKHFHSTVQLHTKGWNERLQRKFKVFGNLHNSDAIKCTDGKLKSFKLIIMGQIKHIYFRLKLWPCHKGLIVSLWLRFQFNQLRKKKYRYQLLGFNLQFREQYIHRKRSMTLTCSQTSLNISV